LVESPEGLEAADDAVEVVVRSELGNCPLVGGTGVGVETDAVDVEVVVTEELGERGWAELVGIEEGAGLGVMGKGAEPSRGRSESPSWGSLGVAEGADCEEETDDEAAGSTGEGEVVLGEPLVGSTARLVPIGSKSAPVRGEGEPAGLGSWRRCREEA
jgi:hypothetical protein